MCEMAFAVDRVVSLNVDLDSLTEGDRIADSQRRLR